MADRTVYQAFLTATGISVGILAPVGYFAAPTLLRLVNAAPAVQAEALPFLRIMLVFSGGMLIFYMLGGALRSAGDARTPMVMGIVMTVLNIVFNIVLFQGLGPFPAYGTAGAAMGTVLASGILAVYSLWKLWSGGWVVSFPRKHGFAPDWEIIKSLFKFGLPTGFQDCFRCMLPPGRSQGPRLHRNLRVSYRSIYRSIGLLQIVTSSFHRTR